MRTRNTIATLDAVFKQFHLAHTEGNQQPGHRRCLTGARDLSDTLAVLDIIAEEENLGKLTKAPAFVDAQNELRARQRKISEMTSGGAKNFSVRTGNSNSIRYDVNGFELQFSSRVGPSCGERVRCDVGQRNRRPLPIVDHRTTL